MKNIVALAIEWQGASKTVQDRTEEFYKDEIFKLFTATKPAALITKGEVWIFVNKHENTTVEQIANHFDTARCNIYSHLKNLRKCGRVNSVQGRKGSAHQYYAVP